MSSNIVQPLQQPSGKESEKQSKAYWDDITMDAFIKENPEAIKFKTKGLKNVEQLDILFKDIVATGEGAWAPSQGFVGQDVDDSSKNEGRRKRKRDETKSELVAIQLERWRICLLSHLEEISSCSIVELMKIIRGMLEVKNDFELYMKATDIMVVKENREMFVALEDPIDQIAWLKHKHV
ncbi:hypothetical protein AAG906_015682 [Vitis piasezkii]